MNNYTQTETSIVWKPFFFDGNLWFGLVDSPERLSELENYYPKKKYLMARLFSNADYLYPCFGFKGEGMSLDFFLNI
ncbi:MAG: hypothetical protein QM669_13080 [Siphonobacter sp.]